MTVWYHLHYLVSLERRYIIDTPIPITCTSRILNNVTPIRLEVHVYTICWTTLKGIEETTRNGLYILSIYTSHTSLGRTLTVPAIAVAPPTG